MDEFVEFISFPRMGEYLLAPFLYFISPSKRIYIPYLFVAFLLAILSGFWTDRDQREKLGWRAYLLPIKKILHPSSRKDGYFFLFNAWLLFPLYAPFALASKLLAALGSALLIRLTNHQTGIALPSWFIAAAYTTALFIADDAARFLLHRRMHRSSRLWKIHQVHHSAEVMTPLTLYRVHPLESLLYSLATSLSTGLVTGLFLFLFRDRLSGAQILGINSFGFFFNLFGANLRHSQVWLSFGPLEKIFLSPAQHQIHHGLEEKEQCSNFGSGLACWDLLGKSFIPAKTGTRPEALGLKASDSDYPTDSFASLLFGPLKSTKAK